MRCKVEASPQADQRRVRSRAWDLVELLPEAPAFQRYFEAPLVGRDEDLGHVRQAFERATRERRAHLVTVFGEAGIGKTRLGPGAARLVEDERQRVHRPLPLVRRRNHVLAAARDHRAGGRRCAASASCSTDSPDADVLATRLESTIGSGTGRSSDRGGRSGPCGELVETLARESPARARLRGHPLGRSRPCSTSSSISPTGSATRRS